MFKTERSLPFGSMSLHTHCSHTACVAWAGKEQSHVWSADPAQVGFHSWNCYPKKTLLFFSGQCGKWCPVNWGKGQRHFKVKKGHFCQLNPIQSDILSPKEQEKKNPYLLYFCIFCSQLPCCIPPVELSYVFQQKAVSPSWNKTDVA